MSEEFPTGPFTPPPPPPPPLPDLQHLLALLSAPHRSRSLGPDSEVCCYLMKYSAAPHTGGVLLPSSLLLLCTGRWRGECWRKPLAPRRVTGRSQTFRRGSRLSSAVKTQRCKRLMVVCCAFVRQTHNALSHLLLQHDDRVTHTTAREKVITGSLPVPLWTSES